MDGVSKILKLLFLECLHFLVLKLHVIDNAYAGEETASFIRREYPQKLVKQPVLSGGFTRFRMNQGCLSRQNPSKVCEFPGIRDQILTLASEYGNCKCINIHNVFVRSGYLENNDENFAG